MGEANDPYLGAIQLNEAVGETYYVAVTGKGVTADALSQDLTRQEPIDSINRIVEDHIDSATTTVSSSTSMTLTPVAFNLTNVTLYVNTTNNLFTVNPYTGVYETDVTDTPANNVLPGGLTSTTYNNVAMRPDGELYTFDSNGNYDQLNTGNAQFRHHPERRHHLL